MRVVQKVLGPIQIYGENQVLFHILVKAEHHTSTGVPKISDF